LTYIPNQRARHPVTVAELNDANALKGLADRLDAALDDLTTAASRAAIMNAKTILVGAVKAIRP
jgi:hypothetical protein